MPSPPPLPRRAQPALRSGSAIDRAFALVEQEDVLPELGARDSEPRAVATWDSRHSIDDAFGEMRRAHLAKYVKATMAASMLVCLLAIGRILAGGAVDDAQAAGRATLAKMREVPTEVARVAASPQTLTARTQAALRLEKRREAARPTMTASRARAFW